MRARATRSALIVALLLASPPALAFFVEIGEIVGGRQVEITGSALGGSVLLRIINREDAEVSCEITIRTGGDSRTRKVKLPPLKSRTLNHRVRAGTQRVRVGALCQ